MVRRISFFAVLAVAPLLVFFLMSHLRGIRSEARERARAGECPNLDALQCGAQENVETCVDRWRGTIRDSLDSGLYARWRDLPACSEASLDRSRNGAEDPAVLCDPALSALDGLRRMGPQARRAEPELRRVLIEGDVFAKQLAALALAGIDAVHVVPEIRAELESPIPFCQSSGLRLLVTSERAGFRVAHLLGPQLIPLLRSEQSDDASEAAQRIRFDPDPRVLEQLEDVVARPPWSVQAPVATALGTFGPAASGALKVLRRLARTHWAYPVRKSAAEAVAAISGDRIDPQPPDCVHLPASKDGADWTLTLSTGRTHFAPLGASEHQQVGSCSQLAWDPDDPDSSHHTNDAVYLARRPLCVIGVDHGEFGGQLRVQERQTTLFHKRNDTLTVRDLEPLGSDVWAISGGAHMIFAWGNLARLRFPSDGQPPVFEHIDELPGEPLAISSQKDSFLLLTQDETGSCPGNAFAVLPVTPDGAIESVH